MHNIIVQYNISTVHYTNVIEDDRAERATRGAEKPYSTTTVKDSAVPVTSAPSVSRPMSATV